MQVKIINKDFFKREETKTNVENTDDGKNRVVYVDIFESMLENFETWYLTDNGVGMLIQDVQLWDC